MSRGPAAPVGSIGLFGIPGDGTALGHEGLGEQRIHRIYSKYVEAGCSVNESPAGVTYERLAQSLRA